jgi:hypothetical protein
MILEIRPSGISILGLFCLFFYLLLFHFLGICIFACVFSVLYCPCWPVDMQSYLDVSFLGMILEIGPAGISILGLFFLFFFLLLFHLLGICSFACVFCILYCPCWPVDMLSYLDVISLE